MKAAWFEEFGAAKNVLRFGDQPQPQPSDGEVLVRLATSDPIAVNP